MSGVYRRASRAWMTSLVLHTAAMFAAIVIALWPAHEHGSLSVPSIDTRSMSVGLVLLDRCSAPSTAPPLRVTDKVDLSPAPTPAATAPVPPTPPAPPSSTDTNVQPAAFVEPSASPIPQRAVPRADETERLPAGAITAFYGIPAVGASVVFVIDRSASMGLEGRLERARREVAASLQRLPPTARFQVIAYHRSAEPLVDRGLAPATPNAVSTALDALDRLIPEGGTDHPKALRAALALLPDVICFLTDDDDFTPEQVHEITRLNRAQSSIHALCFIEPYGHSWMTDLARQNRGVFRVVR
jgi:von Willebrand factor type A domain